MGAENRVTLCDLGVFVGQAAEPVPEHNAHTGHFRRWMRTPGGRILLQCPVRPVGVVMIDVFAEDQPQVHPVHAFAAGAGDPPLRDRVRPGRLHRGLDDLQANRGEHRVERGGELGIPVPDQELQACGVQLLRQRAELGCGA